MYSLHTDHRGVPLKLWDSHAPFEQGAMDQLRNLAAMPIIHKHVAGMPDVHQGIGATVGSVIATRKAIIPAAVGVDIGCGMMALRTTITAEDLPDNCDSLRSEIEAVVPKGFETSEVAGHRKGGWADAPTTTVNLWNLNFSFRWDSILEKHPKIEGNIHPAAQLGTMGGGNHFIELCLDEDGFVWVMLHSGSRGMGNRIGTYFISQAKELFERSGMTAFLPDPDLACLGEDTPLFEDYIQAMTLAQDYAMFNRVKMMEAVLDVLRKHFNFDTTDKAVNCHHNYATRENHFGANVWVTRKGAVRARKDDLGVIPGSMGTGSFIVRGLGNEDSFCSCSHGAGRVMSRMEAKRRITMDDHRAAVAGVSCRTDEDVLDESPAAYKDIGAVMAAQSDLVEVLHRLKQFVNIKG